MTDLCSVASQEREEPLTATASRVERWLLVEHGGAWGPESVPSSRMSKTVSRSLARTAATALARLVLVRRPSGHPRTDGRWVFAVDSRPGREVVLARHVADDHELVDLVPPYGDRAVEGWQRVDGPLYLVCTHGRHDRCCALRGRPVAQALAEDSRSDRVWESSHVGGDRFAANLVVLPEGLFLGRIDAADVVAVAVALAEGTLPAGHVRGRSSLPLPTQAAQQFAREATGRWGVDDLAPTLQESAGPDTWRIVLASEVGGAGVGGAGVGGGDVEVVVRYDRHGDGAAHVLSCGDPAKTAPLFRQVSLTVLAAAPA